MPFNVLQWQKRLRGTVRHQVLIFLIPLEISSFVPRKRIWTIDGLLILQSFDGNADVDGKMFYLAHGGVADVTALEINREACEI